MLNQLYIFLIIALATLKKQITIQLFQKNKHANKNSWVKKIDIKGSKLQKSIKNLKIIQNAIQSNTWPKAVFFRHFLKNQNYIFKAWVLNSSQQFVTLFITHLKIIHLKVLIASKSIGIDLLMESLIQDGA